MNREILFRGKRVDNNEWVYGGYMKNKNGIYITDTEHYHLNASYKNYLVISETVSQYTGLTDKNGKKIFEGDMLKSYYNKPGIVKWNNEIGAFQIKGIPSQTMKRCYQMEVIGNIYENKINE